MNKKSNKKQNNLPRNNPGNTYSIGGILNSYASKAKDSLKESLTKEGIAQGLVKSSGAIGSALGKVGNSVISGGLESNVGNAIGSIGGTVGSIASKINPVLGGAVSLGSGILGGVTNKLFGSKLNTGNITKIQTENDVLNRVNVSRGNIDDIESQWLNQDFGTNFTKSDIGKDGLFSNKAKKKYKSLKLQREAATNRALTAFDDAIEATDINNDLNIMANYAAFGGSIDTWGFGNGSIAYELANENLDIKKMKANKENQSLLPNLLNTFDLGGTLNTNGTEWSNGLSFINNGGSHEENPMEGVPIGIDPEGNPNLVEQGEVVFNDYVFSNRLKADKNLLGLVNLPTSYNDKSFADVAKKVSKESNERPNDPISKRGLNDSLLKLQLAQEISRQNMNENNKFSLGGKKNKYSGEDTPTMFMARAAAKREGFDVGQSLEDYYKNPIPITTDDSGGDDFSSNNWESWLRYAPVLGSTIGLAENIFNKPSYSNADLILNESNKLGNYKPVSYNPLSNYLQYKPLDRNYYTNKLSAQAGATRRAIMDSSNPSRNAALLAADYNAQNQLGTLARQAEEYNLAQRQAVENFNRGTNQANSSMGLQAAIANQNASMSSNNARLNGIIQAMNMKDRIKERRDASISANMTNLFDSLGNIGFENVNRNMLQGLYESGAFGSMTDKTAKLLGLKTKKNKNNSKKD